MKWTLRGNTWSANVRGYADTGRTMSSTVKLRPHVWTYTIRIEPHWLHKETGVQYVVDRGPYRIGIYLTLPNAKKAAAEDAHRMRNLPNR